MRHYCKIHQESQSNLVIFLRLIIGLTNICYQYLHFYNYLVIGSLKLCQLSKYNFNLT